MSFWAGKKACWEFKRCIGEPGKGREGVAYRYTRFPCWKAAGTLCKGRSGKDISVCGTCEVYAAYGNNEPILCFDAAKAMRDNIR